MIDDILEERNKTHGDYGNQAELAQTLKGVFRRASNWKDLHPVQRDSLEMQAVKISRILEGNPDEPDHWLDVSGYSKLVYNWIKKRLENRDVN